MLKIIGFVGAPATGKTTLMRAVMRRIELMGHGSMVEGEWGKLVKYTWCPPRGPSGDMAEHWILGTYPEGETFGGTDKLSMAVQPVAEEFLKILNTRNASQVVLFEGDRLGNAKFFEFCKALPGVECAFFALRAPAGTLEARHTGRGDHQDATWLKGRLSKVNNLVEQFQLSMVEHATPQDTFALQEAIVSGAVFGPEWP